MVPRKKPQYLDQNRLRPRLFSKQKSLNSIKGGDMYRLLLNCQVIRSSQMVTGYCRSQKCRLYGKSEKELYDYAIAHLLLMVGNIRAGLEALEI